MNPIISINGDVVKQVKKAKFLGILIDDKLKFHEHISYLESRLRQYRGITCRLRRFLSLDSARSLYYSCVHSIITYCICVSFNAPLEVISLRDFIEELYAIYLRARIYIKTLKYSKSRTSMSSTAYVICTKLSIKT